MDEGTTYIIYLLIFIADELQEKNHSKMHAVLVVSTCSRSETLIKHATLSKFYGC